MQLKTRRLTSVFSPSIAVKNSLSPSHRREKCHLIARRNRRIGRAHGLVQRQPHRLVFGQRQRGLGCVLERARGLIESTTAYDYLFRASKHPSAATQAAHAKGTITWDGDLGEVAPLPKFAPEELGDCIDCTICVQVCPTGIDIRNGLQYECIACGACIDACNDVMGKMGYPQGLVRYTTQNAIDGKPSRVLRPRVFVYGGLLLALVAGWAWGVTHRSDLIAEVLRDRNALYREVAGGQD